MRLVLAAALALAACAPRVSPAPPMTAPAAPAPPSPAEAAVRAIVTQEGVHVVHFWAPWCDNSVNELAAGWYEVVEAHPDVTFTFVTVWNDGALGSEALAHYGIPERVRRVVVDGPRPAADERRMTFLGLPVTWIPTTWVFNRGGLLATAFSYGEATPDELTAAIASAGRDW